MSVDDQRRPHEAMRAMLSDEQKRRYHEDAMFRSLMDTLFLSILPVFITGAEIESDKVRRETQRLTQAMMFAPGPPLRISKEQFGQEHL